MATWFDKPGSGRQSDNTFVLGGDMDELAVLSDGDYTIVSQRVDLTNVDVIRVSSDVVGVAMGTRASHVGLQSESDTLFYYPMDRNIDGVTNGMLLGFDLTGIPDISPIAETYSPLGTYCRSVPIGSTTARLLGTNDPQFMTTSPLTAYTVDFWSDFRCDSHANSSGIDPVVAECVTVGTGGIKVFMEGLVGAGAHTWYVAVDHHNAANIYSASFTLAPVTTNIGWTMWSVTYDSTDVGNELRLYKDGALVDTKTIAGAPTAPALDEDFQIAAPQLYGGIDQVRMSDTEHSGTKVLADYNACINAATTYNHQWIMQLMIDGATIDGAAYTLTSSDDKTIEDFAVPARNLDVGSGWGSLTGYHTVAVRLLFDEV